MLPTLRRYQRIGDTLVIPENGPINQGLERTLAPKEPYLGKPSIQDLGLDGVETCRGQRYRYQTPLNLLIYRSSFGNYERVTDSLESTNARDCTTARLQHEGAAAPPLRIGRKKNPSRSCDREGFFHDPPRNRFSTQTEFALKWWRFLQYYQRLHWGRCHSHVQNSLASVQAGESWSD